MAWIFLDFNIWQAVSCLQLKKNRDSTNLILRLKGRAYLKFLFLMNFLKLNECLLWTLHVRPAKSSQTVWGQSVHFFPLLCVSPRYLKKRLWLKILSNKIIQVYNHHCKTIIMSCNSGKWHGHYINIILETE